VLVVATLASGTAAYAGGLPPEALAARLASVQRDLHATLQKSPPSAVQLNQEAAGLEALQDQYQALRAPAAGLRQAAKKAHTPQGRELAAAVESQLGVLHELAQPARSSPAQAAAYQQQTIARVLAQREFRPSAANAYRLALTAAVLRVLEAISESLGRALASHSFLVRVLAWIALGILAAAALTLLYVLIRLLLSHLARWQRARHGAGTPEGSAEEVLPAGPAARQAALAAAQELAARGEWRGALRQIFLALLLTLDLLGALDFRRERTNWEYVRQLRGSAPERLPALEGAVRVFEGRWYGREPATEGDYQAMLSFLRETDASGEKPA
jgi:hypothetical protein